MKLKGKCKSCLGCNKLSEFGFKGTRKCKYYIRANRHDILEIEIFIGIACIVIFGILKLGYIVFEKFSMLAGG